jgi:carbon monoxide dehydrogenase subunit G
MEKQTGVSAAEMSKMGLAAAEMDQRLSAVNLAGLTFINEEDKQYLSNIANMEGGTYKVTLEDGTKKELSDLKQDEFNKLLEQQKTGPKTLEEMTMSQLTIDKTILSNVAAIRESVVQGITSPKQIRQGIAGVQRVTKTVLGETSGAIKTKDFRDVSEGFLTALGGVVTDFKEGNKPLTDVLANGLNRFGDTLDVSQKNFTEIFKGIGENISKKLTNQNVIDSTAKSTVDKVVESYGGKVSTSVSPLTSSVGNKVEMLQNNQNNVASQTTNSKIDIGGKLEINVTAPLGISTEQLKQSFDTAFNSNSFKYYIA